MLDRAARWGILPSYFGWQGNLVETTQATREAILAAMGATRDQPPRMRRPKLPSEPCAAPPERTWGWAIQLYALRSRDSSGIGDLGDLRRLGRWSKKRGASSVVLRPLCEEARRSSCPPQPTRSADPDAPLRTLALLRLVPTLSQRPLFEDRGRR